MELSRQEYELRKPKNWGQVTYESLKRRELERSHSANEVVPPKNHVRQALELHPTVTGPLDGSRIIYEFSEEDQCDFFSRYPRLRILIIRDWDKLSFTTTRAMSVTFAENLIDVDFSNSKVQNSHFEILFVRAVNLSTLRLNNCPTLDTICTQTMVSLLHRSLTELYVKNCPYYRSEPLQWIGGVIGFNSHSLARLKSLDLAGCPLVDKGLLALAQGCKKLQFLNLQDCIQVTDDSVMTLIKVSTKLRLLNLTNCTQLTNKTAMAIGRSCPNLTSLNLGRLSAISDKGIKPIAMGCHKLQAVNLAGLKKITEESMFLLASQNPSLMVLNVTGCERITVNGLKNLIRGTPYIQSGISFMGFKPIDEHIERKLNDQLDMIQEAADRVLREERQLQQQREREQQEALAALHRKSGLRILDYMKRYKIRMHYYRLWRKRVHTGATSVLQRVFRGFRGRCRATQRRIEHEEFLTATPYAKLIQRSVRGYLARLRCMHVSKSVREMYIIRRKEAENAVAVRIQSHARRFLAKRFVTSFKELHTRRQLNMNHAILVMQMLARRFVSIMRVNRRRWEVLNEKEARDSASLKIKTFLLERMRRYKSKLSGEALKQFYRIKWAACTVIQKNYRGFKGRERVHKLHIASALRYYSASQIQRIYRGTQVLHWRDMRLNVIAAYVLDRHYIERRESITAARMRYKQYVSDNRRDSASEPDDDEDEVEWLRQKDHARGVPYWQNFATNEITYDEPLDPLAQEKGLINKRCKIFWVVQDAWYEGLITRYHKRKFRHRVEYDDGDHEWLNLKDECDRVQIQHDDGTWSMFTMYQSETMVDEMRKVEETRAKDEFKARAYEDALQWKPFQDDKTGKVMFLSQKSGEIRAGVHDALDWVVQDDGIGFPCFYNVVTEAMLYEDPRFLYEVEESVAEQRRYVMQELRIAMYFCKDLWECYVQATAMNDARQTFKTMLAIRNSPKPIHLNSFLIRAKALYHQASVVDKPMNQTVWEELEYAQWMAERLAEVLQKCEEELLARKDNKRSLISAMTVNSGMRVFCIHCKRETQRHLDFCPTCGKPQVSFETEETVKLLRSGSSRSGSRFSSRNSSRPSSAAAYNRGGSNPGTPTAASGALMPQLSNTATSAALSGIYSDSVAVVTAEFAADNNIYDAASLQAQQQQQNYYGDYSAYEDTAGLADQFNGQNLSIIDEASVEAHQQTEHIS